ncbi:hypothetical protein [Pseudoalteromonas sp.]|nr:hypothetical protein [Pseudoalteromonas sp.]
MVSVVLMFAKHATHLENAAQIAETGTATMAKQKKWHQYKTHMDS